MPIKNRLNIIKKKNDVWLWIGVDREGKKVLGFAVGDRSEQTGMKLYEKLKKYSVKLYYTDE